jgi:hypothetical protein
MVNSAPVVFNRALDSMDPHLLPEEKLAILQATDPRRKWYSLDDQRVCVLCGRTITGREVEITRDSGGGCSLKCPTRGCSSLPNDWFYRGNGCSTGRTQTSRAAEATFGTSERALLGKNQTTAARGGRDLP